MHLGLLLASRMTNSSILMQPSFAGIEHGTDTNERENCDGLRYGYQRLGYTSIYLLCGTTNMHTINVKVVMNTVRLLTFLLLSGNHNKLSASIVNGSINFKSGISN